MNFLKKSTQKIIDENGSPQLKPLILVSRFLLKILVRLKNAGSEIMKVEFAFQKRPVPRLIALLVKWG